jgi:hypothetical protein
MAQLPGLVVLGRSTRVGGACGRPVPDADPIFAHHATVLGYDDFCAALRQWEALADADGTWTIHRPDDDGPITPPV